MFCWRKILMLPLLFAVGSEAQIVNMSPAQNALNVSPNASVIVTFNQALNVASIVDSTFRIWGMQSGLHRGAIAYETVNKKTILTPAYPFAPGEIVAVTLTNKILTGSGQPLNKFVWQFIGKAQPSAGHFASRVDYGTGADPTAVTVADMDGDRQADLIVANAGANNVFVFKNNGAGEFALPQSYAVGSSPRAVHTADLDQDGDLDLVTGNQNTATIAILKNNGAGVLQNKVEYVAGSNPRSIFAADFDGDGDLDLALATSFAVIVFANNGDGTLQAPKNYPMGNDLQTIFPADLDGDGDLDIAAGNATRRTLAVLLNNGDGVFETKLDAAMGLGYPISAIFAADLDGDGDADVAAATNLSSYGYSVAILKNNGNNTFQNPLYFPVPAEITALAAADLEGDGDVDIVTNGRNLGVIYVLKNSGAGTFQREAPYAVAGEPRSIFAADVDGDGDVDLAVANAVSKTVAVFANRNLISAKVSMLDFGPVYTGFTRDLSFWIYNAGASSVNLTNISSDHPNFTIMSGANLTLSANDSAKITVRYAPKTVTRDSGTVIISPVGTRLIKIGVRGVGKPPAAIIAATPAVLDFGQVTIGKTADMVFSVVNRGVLNLTISNITHANSSFTLVGGTTHDIPPNASKQFVVLFNAAFLGNQSDTLKIFSNDPAQNPWRIPLTAITASTPVPEISIKPLQLHFDTVGVWQMKFLKLTVYNRGAAQLNVSRVAGTGSFGPDLSRLSLAPGDSQALSISFRPAATGLLTGTIDLTSNDANENTVSIGMSGFGKPAPVPALTKIYPASGSRLQTLTVGFKGAGFIPNVTRVEVGRFIAANQIVVHRPDSMTVNLTLEELAATGPRSFSVSNPAPGGGVSQSQAFTVNNPAPTLTRLFPNSGHRLQRLNVGFKGMNFFSDATKVNWGAGIIVNNVTKYRNDSLFYSITIAENATPGPRLIMITNEAPGGGTSAGQTFNITNPAPFLLSLSPAGGNRGQRLNIAITGDNFLKGTTSTDFGAGISVNALNVTSASSMTADITISPTAEFGRRALFISNAAPGGGTSEPRAFDVFNARPSAPWLLKPANRDTIKLRKPAVPILFVWHKAVDADARDTLRYTIRIKGTGLDTAIASLKDTSMALSLMPRLRVASTYLWKIIVTDGYNFVETPDFSFRTSNIVTSVTERGNLIPSEFHLEQNFPNPFTLAAKSAETTIKYQLPQASFVTLTVFDMLGREMIALVNAQQTPGYYDVTWNGRNAAGQLVPGGIYLCRLQAGNFERVMKIMVVR